MCSDGSRRKKYAVNETVYIRATVAHVGDCGQIYVQVAMPGHNPYARLGENMAKFCPDMQYVYKRTSDQPREERVVIVRGE